MIFIASEKQHYTYQTYIGATRIDSTGIITSLGYPGKYPHNANYNYTWTLKTGNLKATISFSFSEFNIRKYHYTSNCEDYLQYSTRDKNTLILVPYMYEHLINPIFTSMTLYGQNFPYNYKMNRIIYDS